MATSAHSVYESSDFVKDFSCFVCASKNIETSADIFCETCLKCFCQNCLYHHDQMFVNHSTHGRVEQNKWPLIKTMEDSLLKCDVHNNKKLKMFCQDHSQLCCSDCVLLNHRQCTNLALISESVNKLSVDMKQLSNKIQATLAELNMYKRTQEISINFVEESCNEKLQEIRELGKKLNADLDRLENSTLQELDEIKTALQTTLKKDIANCRRLKDELQHLREAVEDLCDKSRKNIEFIASRKCFDKIHEFESYLKENPVKVQSQMIFQTNIDLVQYLTKQSCLGRILTIKLNPDQVLTVKRKSEYNVKISSDTSQTCYVIGICSIPCGQVIVADLKNEKVKLLDQHYNVSSHCDIAGKPTDICQITSSEVAVSQNIGVVQFISVSNGQLVKRRELELPHGAAGIAHHQGALYVTSGNALYALRTYRDTHKKAL
ncbi:transcription intermediary factor 1-beta-like [Dreissena polymorpha]|uniref:B box-type domain-containing protein n=1 Tax=Dreissena polymorpha TaxID=45954 RepID=A0A9D4M416_DREPO|nr:transcription intermediary factor 1-beta-like [Dreissena polymorpha]KAH3869813.1 hypothetical protein DPMN_032984 [Dreissena polymorpha]